MKNKTVWLSLLAAVSLAACNDNGNGNGNGDGASNGSGGESADFLTASEIYEGDYSGPVELSELSTGEEAAVAMDLAYLATRIEDVFFSIELFSMDIDEEDTPVTFDGTRTDVESGQLEITMDSSGTVLTETWTMSGENGFCFEKADTSGPVCVIGTITREDSAEFSGGQVVSTTSETTFEDLKMTFRGGKMEMTGTELAQSDGSDANAVAFAADILFTSDDEKNIEEDIRLWIDAETTGIGDPDNFSRDFSMTIASPLLDGRVETTQTDNPPGSFETFGDFDCSSGRFGSEYKDATSGKVEISHDGGSLIAELGMIAGECDKFTVSGGPDGNFPLLGTLFTGQN